MSSLSSSASSVVEAAAAADADCLLWCECDDDDDEPCRLRLGLVVYDEEAMAERSTAECAFIEDAPESNGDAVRCGMAEFQVSSSEPDPDVDEDELAFDSRRVPEPAGE